MVTCLVEIMRFSSKICRFQISNNFMSSRTLVSMSTALESLVEMGFPQNRAEKALAVTGNQGTQRAMDWLLEHQDDPDIDQPYDASSSGGQRLGDSDISGGAQGEGTAPHGAQAKSLKCEDCGKLLRSEIDVQAHAARTQHTNFSESTEEIRPLTAEERKAQLARVEERLKEKRAERQEKERKEVKEKEKQRRKAGKELSDIRQQIELQEAKKLAEQKKKERMEEKLARQRVREQIARDRAEKAAREREKVSQQATHPQPSLSPPPKKEYNTCKLQIRLFGGETLVHTFQATDTLVDVHRHILMSQPGPNAPYLLMTTFPRHLFGPEETSKTLKELGLVPSAVLIQTKTQ